ncbi:MAG: hypothetical protein AAGD07_07730 [Planctomycetota bacterium]
MNDPLADTQQTPTWKTWLSRGRFLVFCLVGIGLAIACRQALRKLDDQITSVQSEIEGIDAALAASNLTPQEQASLTDKRQQLRRSIPTWANIRWWSLALAALFYAVGILPPGLVLHRATNRLGIPCTRSKAMVAQLVGHLGKYIPGKAMVVVMRVGILLGRDATTASTEDRRLDLARSDPGASAGQSNAQAVARATTAVFFETLLMMSVGGTIAGVLICWSNLASWIKWAAAGMAILSLVPTLPPVMQWLIGRMGQLKSGNKKVPRASSSTNGTSGDPSRSNPLTWSILGTSWCWMLLSWVLIGGSFTFLVNALPLPADVSLGLTLYSSATAAIALGIVLGFASLIPGGAGVREAVTLAALAPTVGAPAAVVAALVARLVFLAVELTMAALARVAHHRGLA